MGLRGEGGMPSTGRFPPRTASDTEATVHRTEAEEADTYAPGGDGDRWSWS